MSLQNAINFFRTIEADDDFRESLQKTEKREKRKLILEEAGLSFEDFEVEEAYNSLLRKCQFEYQALFLNEIYIWWKILNE